MKSSFSRGLLIFLGTLFVPILGRPESSIKKDPILAACGDQLSEAIGAISYKADVSIAANERCVWVIRSQEAVSYELEVLSLGLSPTADLGISVTCVLGSTVAISEQKILVTGKIDLGAECPIVVLTFFSGENVVNSRGFVMFYTATTGAHGINPKAQNNVITSPDGHMRHPPTVEELYSSNDVSTFVFAPPNNIHNPSRKTLVTYSKDSLDVSTCNDAIRLYRFNPATGWEHGGARDDDYVCGNVDYRHWRGDDMLMFIFRSDPINVGRGFHITHTEIEV